MPMHSSEKFNANSAAAVETPVMVRNISLELWYFNSGENMESASR